MFVTTTRIEFMCEWCMLQLIYYSFHLFCLISFFFLFCFLSTIFGNAFLTLLAFFSSFRANSRHSMPLRYIFICLVRMRENNLNCECDPKCGVCFIGWMWNVNCASTHTNEILMIFEEKRVQCSQLPVGTQFRFYLLLIFFLVHFRLPDNDHHW